MQVCILFHWVWCSWLLPQAWVLLYPVSTIRSFPLHWHPFSLWYPLRGCGPIYVLIFIFIFFHIHNLGFKVHVYFTQMTWFAIDLTLDLLWHLAWPDKVMLSQESCHLFLKFLYFFWCFFTAFLTITVSHITNLAKNLKFVTSFSSLHFSVHWIYDNLLSRQPFSSWLYNFFQSNIFILHIYLPCACGKRSRCFELKSSLSRPHNHFKTKSDRRATIVVGSFWWWRPNHLDINGSSLFNSVAAPCRAQHSTAQFSTVP